jgi:hypothetical protein
MDKTTKSQASTAQRSPFVKWLLEGHVEKPEGAFEPQEPTKNHHKTHVWWQVMCLTGVDYFSTLGYQPSIAIGAVGALSPIATFVLILVTLFGAYPVYARVAAASPNGEGSISMLQKLLSWWKAKIFVLVLLGFAATDFVITMTLSAADAAEHVVGNAIFERSVPHAESYLIPITLALLMALGAVFLKGFKEAIGIAVVLVVAYMGLNGIVIGRGLMEVFSKPEYVENWKYAVTHTKAGVNPWGLILMIFTGFPKLALGLSGFETGVSVMSLVTGKKGDTEENPAGRIRGTRKLLLSAALIMSVMLMTSSVVTSMLIPMNKVLPGGEANGRALSYLAHMFMGDGFGTVYDVSTILILWFAGASAMAGLLNLVPRYLPKFGMAPEWTKASRPLVLLFLFIAISVTVLFKVSVNNSEAEFKAKTRTMSAETIEAEVKAGHIARPHSFVDAQAGAYATGVLVLMSSAALAVTIAIKKKKKLQKLGFGLVFGIFIYTLVMNVWFRPDGLRIAVFFIVSIIILSFLSRVWRTLELRVDKVDLDLRAIAFVQQAAASGKNLRIIPNRPQTKDAAEYSQKEAEARRDHDIAPEEEILFVEISVKDSSNFSGELKVRGYEIDGYKVLRATGVAVPNSLAALLLRLGKLTGKRPHAYFNWGEQNPGTYIIRFFFSGEGDIAPLTREILRRVEQDPELRPVIHAAS